MLLYYELIFALSVVCCIVFFSRVRSQHDISCSFLFLLISVSEFGSLQRAISTSLDSALLGNTMFYVGGCFMQIATAFLILSLSKIKVKHSYKVMMIASGFMLFSIIATNELTHIYYKSVELGKWNGITILIKEYNWAHNIFYIVVGAYFLLTLAIAIDTCKCKSDASLKTIFLILAVESMIITGYAVQLIFKTKLEITALSYLIAQIVFLFRMEDIAIYNINNTVTTAIVESGDLGCFTFSLKRKYLGSNEVAKNWFPLLNSLRVDFGIPDDSSEDFFVSLNKWFEEIENEKGNIERYFTCGDKTYKIRGGYFFIGNKVVGYQFSSRDYSEHQKYINLINKYNSKLEKDVEIKTSHIRDIQDRLVFGMADMVESRDNSTGGHIKRTSQIVSILIAEMANSSLKLTPEFCQAVIKAAPMHDLGKIAVDDSVLRKPGKFTPEEYEKMKTHSSEGAVIVKKLLSDIDDDYFAHIAENVAHYHHERMDGTGYPCGLKGDEIPLEARIMAIADVYDALVSKRCYKESMGFEQAFDIIEEGMGSQFDSSLNPYFIAARSKLESFYKAELASA